MTGSGAGTKFRPSVRGAVLGWLCALLCLPGYAADPGAALREFVGGPARLVWLQQVAGDGDDPFCWGPNLVLMGLDTEDGRGKRPLIAATNNYHRPMITPDGDQVVFTRIATREVFVADWASGETRSLGAGYGAAVWRDPTSGHTWVYIADNGLEEWDRHHASALDRVRLDQPNQRKRVWDRATFTIDNVQLSADGRRASAQFPHPRAGYMELPNRSWTPLSRGCWTSMAPDNSYLAWVFDGPHRNVMIHDTVNDDAWRVAINTAPWIEGYEVYHPRWSNDRRFFTLTGPYTRGRMGQNLITRGGTDVEVMIGRFSDNVRTVTDWFQVTDNPYGNFYPDLWLEDVDRPAATAAETEDTDRRPATLKPHLVWDHANAANRAGDRSWDVQTHGRAFWGPHGGLELDGGYAEILPDDANDASEPLLVDSFGGFMAITPRPLDRGTDTLPRIILSSPAHPTAGRWRLCQVRDQLHLSYIDTNNLERWSIRLGEAPAGQVTRLGFSYDADHLRVWINGRLTAEDHAPGLRWWIPHRLRVGATDADADASRWRGALEALRLYAHAPTQSIGDAFFEELAERATRHPAPPRYRIIAQLEAVEEPPAPADIEPYRRALMAQPFTVIDPGDAPLNVGDEIAIAYWAILDLTPTGRVFDPDAEYKMEVSPFEQWPLLEAERLTLSDEWIFRPLFFETRFDAPMD